MHALTGTGIMAKEQPALLRSLVDKLETKPANLLDAQYEAFIKLVDGDKEQQKLYKHFRSLGKKVNFTTEYGAAAPKLAATMLVDEDTAQAYIDAREAAFQRAKEWKQEVQDEAKEKGFVTTKLGARRHLAAALNSEDRYISSKADRQAVNFKIQSSSAEMTKLAEGRMWRQGIFVDFDAVCYGPIHDEVVASVAIEDLHAFIPAMHACMIQRYADMQVPIESSISIGPNFYKQIEIGDKPTEAAINFGLEEIAKL
jgi:DNA polymerase-1